MKVSSALDNKLTPTSCSWFNVPAFHFSFQLGKSAIKSSLLHRHILRINGKSISYQLKAQSLF